MTSVSIIMSVGRIKNLRNTLIGWSRVEYPDFDFTIVDNGSNDSQIESVVSEFKSRLPIAFYKQDSFEVVNRIWNRYGKGSRGEYVIFAMQDEIVSHKDVIWKMLAETAYRSSVFTYFMDKALTDQLETANWQDDPTVLPRPYTDQTTAGLISHITGNYRENWDWFGWFRDLERGHLWLDQDIHLREVVLKKAAVTPRDVYCLHQHHSVGFNTAYNAPGFRYANELQARLLEEAERDAA